MARAGASDGQALSWSGFGIVRRGAVLGAAAVLDALEDFFAVHGHVLRRIDADADLVALDAEDRNDHVFANDNGFTNSSGQYEHRGPPGSLFVICCLSPKPHQASGEAPYHLSYA